MNCGCPAPKPSSGLCGSQPAPLSWLVTRAPTGSVCWLGISVSRLMPGSAMPSLTWAALQVFVGTGGPSRIANAPCSLRYAASGSSHAPISPVQSMAGPSGR